MLTKLQATKTGLALIIIFSLGVVLLIGLMLTNGNTGNTGNTGNAEEPAPAASSTCSSVGACISADHSVEITGGSMDLEKPHVITGDNECVGLCLDNDSSVTPPVPQSSTECRNSGCEYFEKSFRGVIASWNENGEEITQYSSCASIDSMGSDTEVVLWFLCSTDDTVILFDADTNTYRVPVEAEFNQVKWSEAKPLPELVRIK